MNLAVPLALYLLALAVRLLAASELPFPATEPSAYYVGVAQNLLAGEGLVSDGVWSYATPPLVVPKPAFELWLPMATFVSASAMSLLGSSYWAAQVGGAVLGAMVAPLAFALARETTRLAGLDERRGRAVAITAGLLAAVLSPLVLASAALDSSTPFTVFVLAAALLVPRVIGARDDSTSSTRSDTLSGVLLGLLLGLGYLSRQETIWLGLTVVLMLAWVLRGRTAGSRLSEAARRLWPVVAGGLVVVTPWLLRNWLEFGSPFPGQAVENMFLLDNEDIFAFRQRPSAGAYLEQGLATIAWNPLAAAWDGLVNVLTLPAFPVGAAGLLAIIGMRRSAVLRRPSALLVVLVSGALIFVSTVVLFPVATLWGTFMHASGPLLVGLAVMAALGGDALLARVSAARGWQRPNVVIAPVALLVTAGLMTVFQVGILADQSRGADARYARLAESLERALAAAGLPPPRTLITDHPMWLSAATGAYAVALPDEDLASIMELGRLFETRLLVVVDERGRYPRALLGADARDCLVADPVALDAGHAPAWLFQLGEECSEA